MVSGGLMRKLTGLELRPVQLALRNTGTFVGTATVGISLARIVAVAAVVLAAVSGRLAPLKLMASPGMPPISAQKFVPVKVNGKSSGAPDVRTVGLRLVITG